MLKCSKNSVPLLCKIFELPPQIVVTKGSMDMYKTDYKLKITLRTAF
jgi:hypothetical protein